MLQNSAPHPDIELANRLGIPADIHVVSCGALKADHACPARDLYTSDTFRKAFRFTSTRASLTGQGAAPVLIASALHGLLDPDTIVEPYDATIKDYTAEQKALWTRLVRAQLRDMGVVRATFHAHAGGAYSQQIREAVAPYGRVVEFFNYWRAPKVGRDKGIGYRRGWYSRTAKHEISTAV